MATLFIEIKPTPSRSVARVKERPARTLPAALFCAFGTLLLGLAWLMS
jgi:hypothetical protein